MISYLYHVSPRENRESIYKSGIDPVFSRGKRDVCWFVDRSKLLWAVAHCSARHHVSVDRLDVWIIPLPLKRQTKTQWQGVFTSPCRVVGVRHFEASAILDSEKETK